MSENTKIISIGQIDLSGKRKEPDLNDLPVLPTRDFVLFPGVTFPISLGREWTIELANKAAEKDIAVGVICQTDPDAMSPECNQLHEYGVIADVIKVIDLPDGTHTAIVSARQKIKVLGPGKGAQMPGMPAVEAEIQPDTLPRPTDKEFLTLVGEVRATTIKILHHEHRSGDDSPGSEMIDNIKDIESPELFINLIATQSPFSADEKMVMLRKRRLKDRALELLALLSRSEQIAEIRAEIQRKTRRNIDEQQRNHFLQQQFDTLREELYGDDDDCRQLEKKAEKIAFTPAVRKIFNKELDRLRKLNPQSPDYATQYSYLQLVTDLPWGKYDPISTDFNAAEAVLEADHYGLEKVKERILEQLAVMMNTPEGRSPIICLVGAPGVGKTSLGQSIAKALGRKYQRVSLGGIHDEAEIRGHRRTYIGAMPGRIIDAIKRAGASNPVLLLDEIDKTGGDIKGDPSAALLEVLDPEQNKTFHDNYVDIDFDLSKTLFIATANTTGTIPPPLLDRMELIEIPGYLLEEKVEIARRHLIPRAARENGFADGEVTFTHDAIVRLIERYTAESGVRQLEQAIGSVMRKTVLRKMRGEQYSLTVTPEMVGEYLGVERFNPERYEVSDMPGVAVGLAWTRVGGEILFIESVFSKSKNETLTLTGNLGDVMKESAMIALQVVRARSEKAGVDAEWFDTRRLNIHVPEGAIPKDGPSAGITIATSIMSALSGKPVKERLAMTGELTLRGKVLPVGGIKEKILAAKRAGITDIILCNENRKDIADIKPDYLEGITFHYVSLIDEVFKIALGL